MDTKIYVVGGRAVDYSFLSSIEMLDAKTRFWEKISEGLFTPRMRSCLFMNPKSASLIIAGGLSAFDNKLSDIYSFDTVSRVVNKLKDAPIKFKAGAIGGGLMQAFATKDCVYLQTIITDKNKIHLVCFNAKMLTFRVLNI